MEDLYIYEKELISKGIKLIGGIDEVGRGPLVGPVVAACVILPLNYKLEGLTDSKKLSEKKREKFFDILSKDAISIGIGIIDEKKIDEVNIYEATKLAMTEAFNKMDIKPEHVLIDAMPLSLPVPTTSIIKGDAKSLTIAAASVIAKVTRDHMMDELHEKYPYYNFKKNKGYPTKEHVEAINKYGIIKEHRKSYGPVKDYIEKNISNKWYVFYIPNKLVATWKYTSNPSASTIVVINGLAMTVGSNPSFLVNIGSVHPINLATTTIIKIVKQITIATK